MDLDDEMRAPLPPALPHQVTAGVEGSVIGNADAERVVLRVRQKLEGVEVRHHDFASVLSLNIHGLSHNPPPPSSCVREAIISGLHLINDGYFYIY